MNHYSLDESIRFGRQFLPARRYASAGTTYGSVSVSVCSVTSRCSTEVVGRIELVFGTEAFLTSPILCFKEIQQYELLLSLLFP